jgi:hypothetical protein
MIRSFCSSSQIIRTWSALAFFGALAMLVAEPSHAATIYAPTSGTLIDADVSSVLKQATRFQTTATDYVVTGVSFEMRQDSLETPEGSLNWLIYTDAGDLPGLPVPGLIFNQDVSTLTGSYTTVSTGALSVALAPSTNYWLVLNGQSLTSGIVQIQHALTPSGPGGPFRVASDAGTWSGIDGLAVVGTITAVPEPGALALGAIGAGLAALVARRHKLDREARHSPAALSD